MNNNKVKVEFIESYIKIGNGNYKWNDNHGELIRCKDCCHWKPPHIRLNDGKQRAYKKGDKEDPFGIGVSADVGLNVGGMCWVDHNCGYGRDMRVHRRKDDFCSRADKLPNGITGEEFWGLSEEPTELRDDFDY